MLIQNLLLENPTRRSQSPREAGSASLNRRRNIGARSNSDAGSHIISISTNASANLTSHGQSSVIIPTIESQSSGIPYQKRDGTDTGGSGDGDGIGGGGGGGERLGNGYTHGYGGDGFDGGGRAHGGSGESEIVDEGVVVGGRLRGGDGRASVRARSSSLREVDWERERKIALKAKKREGKRGEKKRKSEKEEGIKKATMIKPRILTRVHHFVQLMHPHPPKPKHNPQQKQRENSPRDPFRTPSKSAMLRLRTRLFVGKVRDLVGDVVDDAMGWVGVGAVEFLGWVSDCVDGGVRCGRRVARRRGKGKGKGKKVRFQRRRGERGC